MALSEEKIKQLKEEFIKEHGPITDKKWDKAVRACTDWAEFTYELCKEK